MDALNIFLAGTGGAAAIKLFEGVILWFLNRRAKLTDEQKASNKAEEEKRILENQYMLDTIQSLKTAQRTILHDRIKYLCKCFTRDGCIDMEDLGDLMEMHEIYHYQLSGNGKLDRVMSDVKSLPIKK